MSNIYDFYLQFKAIGAIEYQDELLVFSKDIDTVLIQENINEEYSKGYILPFYRITSIIKKDVETRKKSLWYKIINGKILFDNINFIIKIQDYIRFLLIQRESNVDFSFVRRNLSKITNYIQEFSSLQNPRLKEIYLSLIKQRAINLYDNLYFDKEEITDQIEKSKCEIDEKHFLSLIKLINLTAKTDTKKLEKTVTNLIAQNFVLSYYQSISKTKDFDLSERLFIILQTNYPYEDLIFDIKKTFERKTESNLYIKYDSPQQHIIFDIISDNEEERHSLYNKLINTLQKYLENSKSVFKVKITDAYPDIWAFELNNSAVKQSLNSNLHNLMFALRHCWTQDYAVSISLIVISKILGEIYKNESECSEMMTMLYENWFIFLFENYTTTNIYQFNKNKEIRTTSLIKQVESMNNDIELLSGFCENEEINDNILKIQDIVMDIIDIQTKNHFERDNIIIGLFEEICSSLGVYKKNLPYIALLIKTYKESLWKIY